MLILKQDKDNSNNDAYEKENGKNDNEDTKTSWQSNHILRMALCYLLNDVFTIHVASLDTISTINQFDFYWPGCARNLSWAVLGLGLYCDAWGSWLRLRGYGLCV